VAFPAFQDTTPTGKLNEGKRGWPRCIRPTALSQFQKCAVGVGVTVVVVMGGGFGRRNNMLCRLSNAPVLTKIECGHCEIELAEGVAISTPSATHLVGQVREDERRRRVVFATRHILAHFAVSFRSGDSTVGPGIEFRSATL